MLERFYDFPAALRYGLAFGVPFLITLLVTPLAARTAVRYGLVDHPAPNKAHIRETPYLGGAALVAGLVVIGTLAASGSIQLATMLLCAIVIGALGLVDDIRGLTPPTKLAVEAAAATALYFTGSGGGAFGTVALDLPLTIAWVIVVTNSFNLLDNMDGLAPGVAAMSAFAFFAISAWEGHMLVASVAVALAGACVGFLRHNFPPARVFLGDAGSLLVGFLLAALGLNLDLIGQDGIVRVAIPLLAVAVALFDTTLVVVARIRDRRPIFVGGTDHASHRLVARGMSHTRVAVFAIAIQAACSGLAVTLHISPDAAVVSVATVVAALAAGALAATLRLDHPGVTIGGTPRILGAERGPPDAA